jgi:hypothetical protein
MTTQAVLWAASGAAALVSAGSALADRARMRRRNLDSPGWVPWPTIQLLAMITAVVAAALAIKA